MFKFIQINICSTSLYFIHFSFTSYFRPHQGCCSRASLRRRPEAMQGGFQGLPKAHVFDKGHNHHNHHNPWGVVVERCGKLRNHRGHCSDAIHHVLRIANGANEGATEPQKPRVQHPSLPTDDPLPSWMNFQIPCQRKMSQDFSEWFRQGGCYWVITVITEALVIWYEQITITLVVSIFDWTGWYSHNIYIYK